MDRQEDETIGQAEPVTLEEAIAIVDSWESDYAPFRLHQVCRVLRQAYEECSTERNDWGDRCQEAESNLADLRADAGNDAGVDRCAEPAPRGRSCQDHPGGRSVATRRHADMVVWLLEAWAADVLARKQHGAETELWTDRIWRACEAIPCSAGIDNCHAPYYRHQPCCNLRVALWPGDEFPTDYLPDSGEVHLFEPGRENAPRVSAGCVKLVEPTALGWLDALTEYANADSIYMGDVPASILEAGNRPMQGGEVV